MRLDYHENEKRNHVFSMLSLLLVTFSANAAVSPCQIPADIILYSGKIVTVDENSDIVEALAIRDGKIIETGNNRDVLEHAGTGTKKIDLIGKTVIPGFIDAHSHPTTYGLHVIWPDLSTAKNIAEILSAIATRVKAISPGEWVTNSRIWNETNLEEQRNPTRWDLDTVSPKNPVFLKRGHLGVANSAALVSLGISEKTPNPNGGTFERDSGSGALTGRVYGTAMDVFVNALPRLTLEQIMAAQRQSYQEMSAAGITSVRSVGFGSDSLDAELGGVDELRGFLELKKRQELTLRTSVTIRINPNQSRAQLENFFSNAPAMSGFGDDMLSIWGIKLIADGGSDLAYLRKDYRNRLGYRGQLGGTLENFIETAKLANRYGWRVATHALGDAAIDFVLNVYETVANESPINGKRWSIEHGYFLRPEHYDRIKKLGLMIHPQTWHLYNLHRNFVANYPDEYAQMSHPYRTILDQSISIAGGMDWYITDPSDVFFYIWVEISRQTADGYVVGPEQRLSRDEALRLHTIWAAYSTFDETKKGSLEPGKFADLVILSDDYMTVPQEEIRNIKPILTMVGGRVVFQDRNSRFSFD